MILFFSLGKEGGERERKGSSYIPNWAGGVVKRGHVTFLLIVGLKRRANTVPGIQPIE